MSAPSAGGTAGPVSPVYPFNEPGQPIMLYDGPIGGLAANEVPGTVELACTLRPSLEWSVGSGTRLQLAAGSPVTLLLRRSAGDAQLPAYVRGIHGGWSNGARLGRADLPLQRIVAHWFNLPDCLGPRWVTEAGGWRISLDVRPDLQRIWTELQRTDTYVMTHVMEVRQADGDGFTAEEAGRLLETLHIGMSFALGRWAAPMLPVGEDTDGRVVWEDWRLPLCDRAQDDGSGWWTTQDHQDLADFLGRIIPFFADPDKRAVLRLPMMYAIISGRDQGFVEQRITSGATGLEHITWQRLVVGGVVTKPEYNRIVAHARLRYVLVEARIPVGIEPDLQPSIAQFAAANRDQGITMDGAHVVTRIRNRIVHPDGRQERIYQQGGLLKEIWLLTQHYLVLLILHSLGYQGLYTDLRKLEGWPERTKVPWAPEAAGGN